jgi:heme/copper-type cytochrome/quinol oxidase subunit 2
MKPYRFLLVAAIVLSACTPASSTTSGSGASSSSIEASSSSSVMAPTSSEASSSSAATQPSSVGETSARIIEITTDNFLFSPSSISVKKGEKVTLRLSGKNGIHGFAVPNLGLSLRVEAGQTQDVVLDTSATGTFSFFCNIPCGPGHKDMKGMIVIS